MAAMIRAGVIGSSLNLIPIASNTALATAAATPVALSSKGIGYSLAQALIGHPQFNSLQYVPSVLGAVVFICVLVGVAAYAVLVSRREDRSGARADRRIVLMFVLAAAAPVAVLAYATFFYDILLAHNLLASVPFGMLALSWIFVWIGRRTRWVGVTAAVVAVVVMSFGAARSLTPRASKANYRQALGFIDRHFGANDVVLDDSLYPLTRYFAVYVPAYFPNFQWVIDPTSSAAAAAWRRAATGHSRVFVIFERISWLAHYRPPRFGGYSGSCATASPSTAATLGCAALVRTRTYPGEQPLVVSEYSGR